MEDIDDLFNDIADINVDNDSVYPKMTKDEFITKTRSMLQRMIDEYSNHFKRVNEDDESEENTCTRCNGFLYIEQGGDIVDCYACNGSGFEPKYIFDTDGYMDFIEHTILFGDEPFHELLHCELRDI